MGEVLERKTRMESAKPAQALDALIIGAGFSGLYMLFKARQMGLKALAVEAAPEVGGTWRHNCYPGARVDIESMEYSFQFSEALQQEWRWTERYAGQPELLAYANHVADRFDLRDGIQLSTRIARAVFDETDNRWLVAATNGASWSARFLVMASGPLSTPNKPALKGLETFAGAVYHTAEWPRVPVDFAGKKVAVIGTGSSGVQAIPLIAQQAGELTVFQRTAAYVVPARNGPLDPAYEARIKKDYAGFRARNSQTFTGMGSEWPPGLGSALAISPEAREAAFEERWRLGGFSLMRTFDDIMVDARVNAMVADFVRSKIRAIVQDLATAATLSPKHTIGCKRLCVGTDYYETFNRENVRLVDLNEHPIEEIAPEGLNIDGETRRFDALVMATGFDAVTGALKRLDIRGRDGLAIQQKWREGPLNYLGLMTAGFPNLFHMASAGSAAAFSNVIASIEHHGNWIADCIAHLDAKGAGTIEATEQAEAGWMALGNAIAERTLFLTCNSWYLGANIPGKPRHFMPFVGGFPTYVQKCAAVAADGYQGFAVN
jgi:cation diffusion facilitator CzcD-associated flavoprotein CzcO